MDYGLTEWLLLALAIIGTNCVYWLREIARK